MITGILSQLLSGMKVSVKTEHALGDATNIPELDTTNVETKLKLDREEYNIQYSSGHLTAD